MIHYKSIGRYSHNEDGLEELILCYDMGMLEWMIESIMQFKWLPLEREERWVYRMTPSHGMLWVNKKTNVLAGVKKTIDLIQAKSLLSHDRKIYD